MSRIFRTFDLVAGSVVWAQAVRSKVPSLLHGLVFDDAGGRLTPSHANTHGVCYRYYVSKSRLCGRPRNDERDRRKRIPGAELEETVLTAVRFFLINHNKLSAVLSLGRLTPVEAVFASTSVLAEDLTTESPSALR